MLIDIEIRGVVVEKAEYRSGDLTGNPTIKYQMRKLIKKHETVLFDGHYKSVTVDGWTEWEDIPIK